jgi:hypothetical protein
MDSKILHLYLSRILSGFYIFIYNDTKYKLVYPDISLKYNAELYADLEYETNKYNEWIKDEEIVSYLVDFGQWSWNGDDILKKMEKEIDDYKIQIYNNFLNPQKIRQLKQTIENIRQKYNKYYSIRHSMDHLTIQGYSQILKNQFILINSLYYNNNDTKVFDRIDDTDYNILNTLSNIVNDNHINIDIFRKIARSEIWKNYWSANKDNLFNKATINWTDEQKTLVVLSKMYDSAYEHPNCPPDEVFEDDDAFDGWMLIQRKESEKNKKKSRAEKLLEGKNLGNAQEVFLMANSKEEAENIYTLNENSSRHIINERNAIILNSNKNIDATQLPDAQRALLIESNKQFMQRGS